MRIPHHFKLFCKQQDALINNSGIPWSPCITSYDPLGVSHLGYIFVEPPSEAGAVTHPCIISSTSLDYIQGCCQRLCGPLYMTHRVPSSHRCVCHSEANMLHFRIDPWSPHPLYQRLARSETGGRRRHQANELQGGRVSREHSC